MSNAGANSVRGLVRTSLYQARSAHADALAMELTGMTFGGQGLVWGYRYLPSTLVVLNRPREGGRGA